MNLTLFLWMSSDDWFIHYIDQQKRWTGHVAKSKAVPYATLVVQEYPCAKNLEETLDTRHVLKRIEYMIVHDRSHLKWCLLLVDSIPCNSFLIDVGLTLRSENWSECHLEQIDQCQNLSLSYDYRWGRILGSWWAYSWSPPEGTRSYRWVIIESSRLGMGWQYDICRARVWQYLSDLNIYDRIRKIQTIWSNIKCKKYFACLSLRNHHQCRRCSSVVARWPCAPCWGSIHSTV